MPQNVPENEEIDERYCFRDMNKIFKTFEKKKLIEKATFTIVYHPMLLLAKEYGKVILKAEHIVLLCYLMGYIKNGIDSESFWGSNNTIAKDLKVSTRTIQRRLKELESADMIRTIIDNYCERHIYVNFQKIWLEIVTMTLKKYDTGAVAYGARLTVEYFVRKNLLERRQSMLYLDALLQEFVQQLGEEETNDVMKFFFKHMISALELKWNDFEKDFPSVKQQYIAKANEFAEQKNKERAAQAMRQFLENFHNNR